MDAQALADRMHVSAMAVRQHLYALQAEKLVTYRERRQALGRPAKFWQLTAAADRLFPDGYDGPDDPDDSDDFNRPDDHRLNDADHACRDGFGA